MFFLIVSKKSSIPNGFPSFGFADTGIIGTFSPNLVFFINCLHLVIFYHRKKKVKKINKKNKNEKIIKIKNILNKNKFKKNKYLFYLLIPFF